MRDIKFRAWINGRMEQDVSVVDGCAAVESHKDIIFSDDEWPLMQYTGLKDKNGVEICTGDICSTPGVGNAVVKICPFYGVVLDTRRDGSVPIIDCMAEGDESTVIGNIYENKELLNG